MMRIPLLIGVALLVAACGRLSPDSSVTAPRAAAFQALVAGAPDAEGNAVTTRFDSASGRSQVTQVPTNATDPRFTAAGAISYLLPDSVRSEDAAGHAQRTLVTGQSLLMAGFAWSGGGTLAYLGRGSARNPGSRLVIDPAGGSPVSVPMPASPGGSPSLQFSPDGRLLLVVDTEAIAGAARTTLQVRGLDGRLAYGPVAVGLGPAAVTWAGSRRLYFWDGAGVSVADLAAGTTVAILPGLRWYDPDASPDGRTVVFESRDPRGMPRLQFLDTATDQIEAGFERDGGTLPRFVSPTEVWFHEAGSCTRCSGRAAAQGAIRSLDTEELTEAPTGLTGFVMDVRQVRTP